MDIITIVRLVSTIAATLIETGVDFDIGSWNIDLSVGAGAGIDFYVGKKV